MLTFGNKSAAAAPAAGAPAAQSRADLPKATAWLNFGYSVEIENPDGTTGSRFVSLPVGIPLDTMEPIQITTRNTEFGQFQAAQNDTLQQLKDYAATMQPGEEKLICVDENTGLSVQLRRVSAPVVAPKADESNPFSAKIPLV